MDFFQSQEDARRKTSVLVAYFAVAVACLVVATYFAVLVAMGAWSVRAGHALTGPWHPTIFAWSALATLGLIGAGSAYKVKQLASGGGAAVAQLLGGRLVSSATQAHDERVLLNVVEEMAIASGTPVPRVYVLDRETAINAFAAGLSTSDAVIAVTRGALDTLSRDELQGVIGHELSHVLNGDMRLNIQLMGVLNGILVIAIVGRTLLRGMPSGRRGKGAVGLVLMGLALVVIGYVGVLFGNIIKAAVSRQRELLADAAAVQFTRNPSGLAEALKRIGGGTGGSRIASAQAESASHLFFAQGVKTAFFGVFATHPPLSDRIRRLDPQWDGSFPRSERTKVVVGDARSAAPVEAVTPPLATGLPARMPYGVAAAIASVGAPDEVHVARAQALVASLPKALVSEVHETLGAAAVACALLLSEIEAIRKVQLDALARTADEPLRAEVSRVAPLVDGLGPEARLPLLSMAIPALHGLSPMQARALKESVRTLVQADQRITLFEFALQRMVFRSLEPPAGRVHLPAAQFSALPPLLPACAQLLSALARFGHDDAARADAAFAAGSAVLGAERLAPPRGEAGLRALDAALDRLARAVPPLKKRILEACSECVAIDGTVTVAEAELLRLVADGLDCPMPPLVDVREVA